MSTALLPHPVALLFPDMPAEDFAALVEDIRVHGVKVPILVHGGQIMDGRHRYLACCKLGIRCPAIEWNGRDPWFELQSRNLVRRHLAKDQIYAIRKLAAEQFPELLASIKAAKFDAMQRKAQAKGRPRGEKSLSRSPDRHRESAEVIGRQAGVSGSTVKRVERLARVAPELLKQVAAGELSVAAALRRVDPPFGRRANSQTFTLRQAEHRLRELVINEWVRWPAEYRRQFADLLRSTLQELTLGAISRTAPGPKARRASLLKSIARGNAVAADLPHQKRA
jgi:ParB-like chromosome segregation protein Spo0J